MKNVGRYSRKIRCQRAGNLAFRGCCLLSLHLEGGMEVDVTELLFAGREGCHERTTKALTYERLRVDIEEAQSLSERLTSALDQKREVNECQ
jgi:hypothetical protein